MRVIFKSTFVVIFSLFLYTTLTFSNKYNVFAADPNCFLEPGYSPQFSAFEPTNPQKGQSVTALFIPPTLNAESKYRVRFNVVVGRKSLSFQKTDSVWSVNLGSFDKGIQDVVWNMIFDSDSGGIENQRCGSAELFICDGSDCPTYPGSGSQGQNPCAGGSCETALGDIDTNPQKFASRILGIATGVGGGIALILMVIGAVRVMTSSGDQQKLSAGRDMITAAISGLLFIIFSVLILRFIGLNILGGIL